MTNHTPGPWKTNEAIVYVEGEEEDFAICHTQSMQTNAISNYEKCCANARLIAVSPELLEQLERSTRALEWWKDHHNLEWDSNDEEQLQNNKAAIAKAKGE